MPSSAINNTGRSVYSGTAVAVNGDTIQMATASVLATALVHLGAGANGIVSLVGTGEVLDLQDWTLATGTKFLIPNAQYFTTGIQGKLTIGSGSQSVGTATSPTTLAVNISPIFSVTQNITNILNQNITTIAQQVSKLLKASGAQLIPGIGPPFSGIGNLGDYYTDTSTGLIYGPKNPSASWIDPTIPPLNARTDAGFKGDGTTADTDKLIVLLQTAYQTGRPVYIPPGIYYLHHPVCFPASVIILGCGHGTTFFGTELRPAQAFNTAYNPNGVKACMLQGQLDGDPTGLNRFHAFDGLAWHDAHLKGIVLRNTYDGNPAHRVAGLNGFGVYYPAENSSLEDVWAEGFETNYYITGSCAPFTAILCSTWDSTDCAWRFEKHPIFTGNYGVARLYGISGDRNVPAFFRVTGGQSLLIDGLKQEQPKNLTDNIVRIDVSPEAVGSGYGPIASIELRGAACDLTGGPGITNAVKIMHTGTVAPADYPRPHIRIWGGYFFGLTNFLSDDSNGVVIPYNNVGIDYFRGAYNQAEFYHGGGYRFGGGAVNFDSPIAIAPQTVAQLQALLPNAALAGAIASSTDGRNAGEGPGAGTGCPATTKDGITWRTFYNNSVLAA